MTTHVTAYIDGGARGNPGPAGFGVRLVDEDGAMIEELREAIGTATNNVAEYRGLLGALEHARSRGYRIVRIRSDSELLVKQMRGEYRVKNAGLKPLYDEACWLLRSFERVTFEHVRREENKDADRLANLAMDEAANREA